MALFPNNNNIYSPVFTVSGWDGYVLHNLFTVNATGTSVFTGNVNILSGGNSGYLLNVSGTMWAKELYVCISGCDFVFDKDYNLMPLDKLEEYLQLNHHLPGIASAKEMESGDGVAIGKLNTALLQKQEETMLYILQLNKQIKAQDDKITLLEQKLDAMEAELAKIQK